MELIRIYKTGNPLGDALRKCPVCGKWGMEVWEVRFNDDGEFEYRPQVHCWKGCRAIHDLGEGFEKELQE